MNGYFLLGMGDCNNNNACQLISAQTQPTLSALTLSVGQLNPAFDSTVTVHDTMFIGTTSATVTPTAASGNASGAIVLPSGTTTITIVFTASNGGTNTYTITAHRLPQQAYDKASRRFIQQTRLESGAGRGHPGGGGG